ncbi:MAG: hypothetical protein EKK64_06645 [Neisseriaceae bacterium]|nr:MAG: hypothetical protein EKK64_06645 [Neisseriaceae bacterium]
MFTRIKERFNETKKWYSSKTTKNRILLSHRTKGPALEYYDGTKHWLKFGRTHRDYDLPAVEFINGDREWWVEGKLHRDYDLPAVIKRGFKEYWINGEKHYGE